MPSSGEAAVEKPARVPVFVSAASVNCGTASSSPLMSSSDRFILPSASGKDAVAEHLFHQPFGLRFAVAALDADQREDAAPDCADDAAIDLDARFGHALDQCNHASVIVKRECPAPGGS